MKITSIRQQQRQTNRYSIYVDEKYSFSLSESALISSGLHSGSTLTGDEVDNYKRLSADDKLYNRALRYVAARPRSIWELESYLQRKLAAPAAIRQTVERLKELDLLNDRQFAVSFVRDRQLLRPSSRRRLQLELKRKRITDADIDFALQENELSEASSLQAVIDKKRRQSKYQDDTKLMQYLARQGFRYDDIKSALA